MNIEIIGHQWRRVKSKINTKIKMGISRLFYQFGISSARDFHMEDQWSTITDSVHKEECKNGELTTGKLMIQW